MIKSGSFWVPFRVGARVFQAVDPRHDGTVVAVGEKVTVRWDDTGWLSDHKSFELKPEGATVNWHHRK